VGIKNLISPPPLPAKILDNFSKIIDNGTTFVGKTTRLIFVCGSNAKGARRELFLKYANKHLGQYYFFKAENIFKTLEENKKDLLSIEKDIASYSDCIVVILESPGSIAELGAFAMYGPLAENILIINENKYNLCNSFINKGPIEKVKKESKYGECIWCDYPAFGTAFSVIKDRINAVLYKKRVSEVVNLKCDSGVFDKLSKTKKPLLCFLADIIKVFGPIKKNEIIGLIKRHFKISTYVDIETELGLLDATGIASRGKVDPTYYMRDKDRNNYFLKYNSSMERLRADVVNYYAKNNRDRLKSLEENV
jgi:hypothetical protein